MESKILGFLPKKNQWMIVLLIGLLLVVIAIPTGNTKESASEYALEEELRLKNILEQLEGVGNVEVMIAFRDSDEVEGVVVIADGAENGVVLQKITEVVQALFDVDSHKIKVMKGNQTK